MFPIIHKVEHSKTHWTRKDSAFKPRAEHPHLHPRETVPLFQEWRRDSLPVPHNSLQ